MAEVLVLRLHDTVVGELRQGQDRSRVQLTVNPGYDASGITLTEGFPVIPGTEPPSDAVSNFLGGYVPEGNHRNVMASRRGIDPADLMGLLREFGGSMAGAVTIRAVEPVAPERATGYLEELTPESLADRLRQALRDTDQGVPDDSRSTLPGFQPKVLARKTTNGWAQPHGVTHSTHILKPQVPHRATRLIDEHYGHLLANHAGLANFTSELCEADGVTFLSIERFDRRVGDDGTVKLVHQEDAAQALRLDWRTTDAKFQDWNWVDNPARPSAALVAELLASIPGGSALVEAWIRRLVFSLVLGDNDAHAKNIALLHTEKGTSLAPAYDMVPNLYQRDMIDEGFRLAFAVNGSFDHRRGSVDSITSEVESWRVLAPNRARPLVQAAVQMCADAIMQVRPPGGISNGLVDKLNWTVNQLVAGSEIGTSPWQDGAPRT